MTSQHDTPVSTPLLDVASWPAARAAFLADDGPLEKVLLGARRSRAPSRRDAAGQSDGMDAYWSFTRAEVRLTPP
jgi:hypothetical protein